MSAPGSASPPEPAPPEPAPPVEPLAAPPAPLPVAAVARRLGIAPATLRTWARRYGLGPGEHAAGAHRRYDSADIARLETMRRLTLAGVPPREAARAALAGHGSAPPPAGPGRGGPGGRVLALPGADAVVRGLGRAAMALDSTSVLATVREELAGHGVVHTWDHVLLPVLAAAGARWASTGQGVEVEHLLSDCVTIALRELTGTGAVDGGRPVLLAAGPGEQHALPLHAVAAGLAERGRGSRVLGPAMPAESLGAAVTRTGAAALFLWSQLPGSAAPAAVAALPDTRPPTSLVVGGPGWAAADLPGHVAVAGDLRSAIELVLAALPG